jgi:hypothetical protein
MANDREMIAKHNRFTARLKTTPQDLSNLHHYLHNTTTCMTQASLPPSPPSNPQSTPIHVAVSLVVVYRALVHR